MFRAATRAAGLAVFRFHDLRHYGATVALNAEVIASIVIAVGGWRTERRMHQYAAASLLRPSENLLFLQTRLLLRSNAEVVWDLEGNVRALEDAPAPRGRADFFERTFRLKKQFSALRTDPWCLRVLLLSLAEGRVQIDQIGSPHESVFQALSEDVDYGHHTVENLRESLLWIIDLPLNLANVA